MERQRQSEKLIPPIQITGLTNSEFVKRARFPMMPEPPSSTSNQYPTYIFEPNNNDLYTRWRENISTGKWTHPKSFNDVIKNHEKYGLKYNSKVTGAPKFTEEFQHEIKLANCNNVTGLEDDRLRILVFEALVEIECTRQWQRNNSALHVFDHINYAGSYFEVFVDEDKDVCYQINSCRPEKASWVDIVMKFTSVSRLDALQTLANYCGMDVNYLTKMSNYHHVAEMDGSRGFIDAVPDSIKINRLPPEQSYLPRVAFPKIYGNGGQVIGAIAMYGWNGQYFCLPATVANGELSIGKYKPTAFFLNQHLFQNNPFTPVVLFQDMRTAILLQQQLDRIPGYNDCPDFIVTSHLGYDLSILPWNFLYDHDVVFIPAPTKFSISMVKAYQWFCDSEKVKSFKVAEQFILPF